MAKELLFVNLLAAPSKLSDGNQILITFSFEWKKMEIPEFPEWLLRLIPPDGQLTRLSDEDFLKMDSVLGPNPRRIVAFPNSPIYGAIEAYNRKLSQLLPLREYNRRLRENPIAAQVPCRTPNTVAEAEASGYVEAKKCVELLSNFFSSTSAFTKYLDDSERAELIRRFKPTTNRRMVHAADLINTLFKEHDEEGNVRNKLHGEKNQRRNKPGK